MNCPVCKRSLAPTLSICPSCGAMMNDTVREELQTKIAPLAPSHFEKRPEPAAPRASIVEPPRVVPSPRMAPPSALKRVETLELKTPKTSPTLVGFQNKSATLPDW